MVRSGRTGRLSGRAAAALGLAAGAAAAVAAASLLRALHRPAGLRPRIDEAAGWRIRALVGGPADGMPVVLVHGLGVSSRYLVPAAQRLAATRRVHVPDLPGHGCSERPPQALDIGEQADVLSAWMRRLGLHRALVIGNSLGCQIAVELAARDPERVSALVLIGPTADPQARSLPRQLLRLVATAPFERPSLYVVVLADYLRLGPRRMIDEARSMIAHRIERTMAAVTVPMLVVRGAQDLIVPHRWAARLAAIAGTPLVTLHDCGHAAHYTRPDALLRVVDDFEAARRRA